MRHLYAATWLVLLSLVATSPSVAAPQNPTDTAEEATTEDVALDASLREKAAAMPVKAANNATLTTAASHMVLVDYDTGRVLAEKAAREKMYPSSMTKMMTLYIIFQQLKDGTLAPDSLFTISEKAWRMQGSKMFVPLGAQVPLEELIKGISIQSGNDGCVAVAEGIAGSEAAFAEQMNAVAKKLGMENSHFTDSSGWPHPENYTTPYDFYLLSAALIRDFPEYYHYFSDREFTYNNIRQFNRNRLLDHGGMKVDGLKTGHTQAAGYGIALSAMDPATKRRVILVINGLNSEDERAQEGEHLLLWGLRNFDNKTLYAPGQTVIRAKTHQATAREVGLTVKTPLIVTLPKPASELKASVTYRAPIAASTPSGTEVGTLTVTLPDGSTQSAPIVTAEALTSRGFFGKILGLFGL